MVVSFAHRAHDHATSSRCLYNEEGGNRAYSILVRIHTSRRLRISTCRLEGQFDGELVLPLLAVGDIDQGCQIKSDELIEPGGIVVEREALLKRSGRCRKKFLK